MKILVINTGSSSIKYQLFDMDKNTVLAHGLVEKIGEAEGSLTHETASKWGNHPKKIWRGVIPNHHDGFNLMVDLLLDKEHGIISERSDITAVGHRVVHGGELFQSPTIIDTKVLEAIRENIPLAPLHNPPNLTGIEVALSIFPEAIHVAVFDTAFHQTIPRRAFLYALPYELYEREKVRRYGFHGTSHSFVATKCAEFLGRSLNDLHLITIHLGNGASVAAIKKGRCIDTSMGMTPLEGLVMGTRSGDVDPALPFFLCDHLKMTLREIDNLLNKKSGLRGICGTNDMREVLQKEGAGDEHAKIAVEVYTYRIKKYIGAYSAALGRLDAIVFTGGIGEHASRIREFSLKELHNLGIGIDPGKNNNAQTGIREISPSGSAVKVLVIPTDEELKIALETRDVVDKSS